MSQLIKRTLGTLRQVRKDFDDRRRLAQWRRIIASTNDLSRFGGDPRGPRIVHLPMIGRMFLTDFEILLAAALNARGAYVEMVFDDAQLPLCEMTTADVVKKGKAAFCQKCVANQQALTGGLPIKIRRVSEFCTGAELSEFRRIASAMDVAKVLDFCVDGVPIGKPAVMVAMRHFRSSALGNSPPEQQVIRDYIVSSLISRHIAQRMSAERPIHAAMMSHGIYSSWEPALETFKASGVRVVAYDRLPGKDKYQFNWDASPQNGDISQAWKGEWVDRQLTDDERTQALSYLASRETFARDAAKFSRTPPQNPDSLRAKFGVDKNTTMLLLVSNLVWDAAAVGHDLIFNDTLQWVCSTIDAVAASGQNIHLVVKPHPAEKMRGTNLFVGEEIRKRYRPLPANVTVLSADADINPMSLMKAADVGISHTSTAGLEMAVLGKPVIPVSRAHYRSKGFTFDPESLEEYQQLIRDAAALPAQYSQPMKELALKYFYVRYFKYQHELPLLQEKGYLQATGYTIESLDELLPNNMEHLDFVCHTILHRRQDFVRD